MHTSHLFLQQTKIYKIIIVIMIIKGTNKYGLLTKPMKNCTYYSLSCLVT